MVLILKVVGKMQNRPGKINLEQIRLLLTSARAQWSYTTRTTNGSSGMRSRDFLCTNHSQGHFVSKVTFPSILSYLL